MKQLLDEQRSKSKLNPQALASLLYRGAGRFEHIMSQLKVATDTGLWAGPLIGEMSRDQAFSMMQRSYMNAWMGGFKNYFLDPKDSYPELVMASNMTVPGGVGLLMSALVISILGSDEQVKEIANGIHDHRVFCCYAQTELGTGSDVQSLKTVAVFDPASDQFEFHSPTTDSIKWWPGDLGLVSTHMVVFARLISNGKDHGVHPFLVQIRDRQSHDPLPGIEVGDIGPKLGYATKDNGFVKFTRFKAPRSCLLNRYTKITQDGSVVQTGNPRSMYSGMMFSRTGLCIFSYCSLFKAVTITIRYSLYRRQFKDSSGRLIPIIEYQLQKDKVFGELSKAYLMNLAVTSAYGLIDKNTELSMKGDFSELQNTHILLCGFKAMFTYWEMEGLYNLIRACGGHGYSNYSGLPTLVKEQFPHQILEGENSVLLLQLSRHLVKCFSKLQQGKSDLLVGNMAFLKQIDSHIARRFPVVVDTCSAKVILGMFESATCFLTKDLASKMFSMMQAKVDPKTAWDRLLGVENLRLATTFAIQLILDAAIEAANKITDLSIKAAIDRLLNLQAVNLALNHAFSLVHCGALTDAHLKLLVQHKLVLIDQIEPDSLVLAEGMQWPDEFLGSAIGHSTKDPYETLLHSAKTLGVLNQYANQIHPSILLYQQKVAKHREQML